MANATNIAKIASHASIADRKHGTDRVGVVVQHLPCGGLCIHHGHCLYDIHMPLLAEMDAAIQIVRCRLSDSPHNHLLQPLPAPLLLSFGPTARSADLGMKPFPLNE